MRVRRLLLALCLTAAACRAESPSRAARSREDPRAAPGSFEVAVDRRIELFSILFRLAGAEEYGQATATGYLAEVDRHFAPYRDHPAVAASRRVRQEAGIGFDAPMSLAVFLDDDLRLIRPLSPWPEALDDRWRKVDVAAYLADVRRFAADSGFDAFFTGQRAYFAGVEDRFRALLRSGDPVAWFDRFFGARAGASYRLVRAS